MRIRVVSMLVVVVGVACASAAQKQVLADISRELDRRDNGQAVAAYERFRAENGEDEAALRALAVGSLRQALASPDAAARRAAVETAERHDAAELYDDVTALLGDEDDAVRAAAAGAVLRSHPDAARVLASALSSGSPEARALAVAALGRKIPDLARKEIRAALADPDDGVRAAAVAALARTDDADALLARAARDDRAGAVRAAAVAAVGRRDRGVARAALADPFLGARLAAVDALGKEGARELLGADPYVALRAAALLGDPAAGGAVLRAALAAPDAALRESALDEAAAIDPGPRAAELVVPLADDPEPRVRLAAGRALGRLGRADRAREVFAAALGADDEDVRRNAAADLVAARDPRGEAALATLAASESPATRRAAVAAFPPRRPVPAPVLAGLADVDFGVRVAAADLVLRAL